MLSETEWCTRLGNCKEMESAKKRGVMRKDRRQALLESPASVSKTSMNNCRDVFSPKCKTAQVMKDLRSPKLSSADGKKDVGGKTAETKITHLHPQGQKRKIQEQKARREDQENHRVCENNQSSNTGSAEKRQKVMEEIAGAPTCSPNPRPRQAKIQLTPTRVEKGNQLKGNKSGKSGVRERSVGTRSPAWMQHSPRPACCLSPLRKPGTPWRECQLRKLKEEQLAAKANRKNAPTAGSSTKPDTLYCVASPSTQSEVKGEMMTKESQQTSLENSKETMKSSAKAATPYADLPVTDEKTNAEMMTTEERQKSAEPFKTTNTDATSMSPSSQTGLAKGNNEMMKIDEQKQALAGWDIEKTVPRAKSAKNLDSLSVKFDQSGHKELNLTDSDLEHYTSIDEGSAVDGKAERLTLTRSPLVMMKNCKEDVESPTRTETAMSRFKAKMSRSYQKTIEYFKEVKNIWDGN